MSPGRLEWRGRGQGEGEVKGGWPSASGGGGVMRIEMRIGKMGRCWEVGGGRCHRGCPHLPPLALSANISSSPSVRPSVHPSVRGKSAACLPVVASPRTLLALLLHYIDCVRVCVFVCVSLCVCARCAVGEFESHGGFLPPPDLETASPPSFQTKL